MIMKRVVALTACALGLAACSSMPSWMQLGAPKPAPAPTTMQFESEPAGAEAKTSVGTACRTPCSMAVAASEFTVTFSLQGYQPQTVPVRVVAPEARDPTAGDDPASPRLVPNPVYVELQPVAPPPAARRKPAAPARAKPKPAPRQAPTAMAPPPAPAPAPASPWPPPPQTR
jgi:hypothetical protein